MVGVIYPEDWIGRVPVEVVYPDHRAVVEQGAQHHQHTTHPHPPPSQELWQGGLLPAGQQQSTPSTTAGILPTD